MLVVVSGMDSSVTHSHLSLLTSPDLLDYPLRPSLSQPWQEGRSRRRWRKMCCHFPQSFPVYRMHRLVSMVVGLLVMFLVTLVILALLKVTPRSAHLVAAVGSQGKEIIESGWESAGGRRVRKLEDEQEYEDEEASEDEDDLIVDDSYEDYPGGEDDNDDNPEFDMKYFDFSILQGQAVGNSDKTDSEPQQDKKLSGKAEELSVVEAGQAGSDTQGTAHGGGVSPPAFHTPRLAKQWENLPDMTLVNEEGLEVVRQGVVFSPAVEALMLGDPGVADEDVGRWLEQLRTQPVTQLQDPDWERCGRPKNQWVQLQGFGAACARYRHPDNDLLLGEVLSFYLSRLLGVGHVPPVALADPSTPRWSSVGLQMAQAGWGDAPVIALTPWLPRLTRDHMPSIFLDALMANATVSLKDAPKPPHLRPSRTHGRHRQAGDGPEIMRNNRQELRESQNRERQEYVGTQKEEGEQKNREAQKRKEQIEKSKEQDRKGRELRGMEERNENSEKGIENEQRLEEREEHKRKEKDLGKVLGKRLVQASHRELMQLLQWSDLVVFDYLTANYDRVAYLMDAAEEDGDAAVLAGTVHNLVRDEATEALWLLDNESGLIDAYTMLYGGENPHDSPRFHAFHARLLHALCLFRRSTMEAVLALAAHPAPHRLLAHFAAAHEPLLARLPDPLQHRPFVYNFAQRLTEVRDWMSHCAGLLTA